MSIDEINEISMLLREVKSTCPNRYLYLKSDAENQQVTNPQYHLSQESFSKYWNCGRSLTSIYIPRPAQEDARCSRFQRSYAHLRLRTLIDFLTVYVSGLSSFCC